jgi:glyoxylase-like metal-dependent hydrolase (beta-lactamase superfamily II)
MIKNRMNMRVDIFKGTAANVNSYILIDDNEVFLIDALRNASEAGNLARYIQMTGKPLRHVLITHGHSDHFMGLRVLRSYFPEARFIVAREGIKEDIIRHSLEMEKDGWLEGNPALYPYEGDPAMKGSCSANADGFDYDAELKVLPTNRMQLGSGAEVQVTALYQPTECAHMTMVYVPAINALFTADLVYHKMFPWMGNGVERTHVHNWIHALGQLYQAYQSLQPMVYPGHGEPGQLPIIEEQAAFLQDFLTVVDQAPSEYEAVAALIQRYPGYYQREFILPSSVANFMREQRASDNTVFRNVYAMKSYASVQRWNSVRKVL